MISQRRIAQLGLVAASAVFVASLGILIVNSSDDASRSPAGQAVRNVTPAEQSQPIALSAAAPVDQR